MTAASTNPYVGPRSHRRGEHLNGRDREIAELRDVLIAERIVLLYSPSGAGKSSLLEAGLRPELERLDFAVLPTVRVGHEVPPTLRGTTARNRYTLSMLLSLEEGRQEDLQLSPDVLAEVTIAEYLELVSIGDDTADPCLFLDQFEELFTLDPTDQSDKMAFLAELGVALRDRNRWALFAMREDFIAQLDPVAHAIPKRLTTRYRLDLLDPAAATIAARRPAERAGLPFAADAATRLIDDLRRVRVQRGGTVIEELGPYVEPVQLQVVCRQLWDSVGGGTDTAPPRIEIDDVAALGNVDETLAAFYVSVIHATAERTGVPERALRDWFDHSLISEQGFRTQALTGPGGEHGPAVLREVQDAHIVRADTRRGALWYELSHDRLVAPIRSSNLAWRAVNLSTLQVEAGLWHEQSRPRRLLITGGALRAAEIWAEAHPDELSELDRAFLDASRDEQSRLDRERRASRRTKRLAVLSSGLAMAATIGLVVAADASRRSRDSALEARAAEDRANDQLALATAAKAETAAALLEAETKADEALAAQALAEEQRSLALAATEEAERSAAAEAAAAALAELAAAQALTAKLGAEESALAAFGKQIEAQAARDEAETARADAERQRQVALANASAAERAQRETAGAQADIVATVQQLTEFVAVLSSELSKTPDGSGGFATLGPPVAFGFIEPGDSGRCTVDPAPRSAPLDPRSTGVGYITYTNRTGRMLEVFWLTTSGRRVPWASVEPDGRIELASVTGWRYLFQYPDGECAYLT